MKNLLLITIGIIILFCLICMIIRNTEQDESYDGGYESYQTDTMAGTPGNGIVMDKLTDSLDDTFKYNTSDRDIHNVSDTDSGRKAKYTIKFMTMWGTEGTKNIINFPSNPHTGNMFAVTHNNKFKLFEVGKLASKAVSTTAMYGTIDELLKLTKDDPNIGNIKTTEVLTCPGQKDITIDLDSSLNKTYLSFITMIAPSSDWFTGFSIDLKQTSSWANKVMVPIFVYVAGTDSNQGFVTEHKPKANPDPISLKNDKELYPDGKFKPIAFALVTRQFTPKI